MNICRLAATSNGINVDIICKNSHWNSKEVKLPISMTLTLMTQYISFRESFLIIHDVKTWIRVSKTKISRNAYQSYAKRLNLDCSYFPQCWGRHSNVDKIEHCNVYKHVPIHLRRKAQCFLHHCFLLRTPTKFWSRMQLRHVWPQKWK